MENWTDDDGGQFWFADGAGDVQADPLPELELWGDDEPTAEPYAIMDTNLSMEIPGDGLAPQLSVPGFGEDQDAPLSLGPAEAELGPLEPFPLSERQDPNWADGIEEKPFSWTTYDPDEPDDPAPMLPPDVVDESISLEVTPAEMQDSPPAVFPSPREFQDDSEPITVEARQADEPSDITVDSPSFGDEAEPEFPAWTQQDDSGNDLSVVAPEPLEEPEAHFNERMDTDPFEAPSAPSHSPAEMRGLSNVAATPDVMTDNDEDRLFSMAEDLRSGTDALADSTEEFHAAVMEMLQSLIQVQDGMTVSIRRLEDARFASR